MNRKNNIPRIPLKGSNTRLLKPTLREVRAKDSSEVLKIPKYDEIDFGGEVMGIVADCDTYGNGNYVRLVVTLYYDAEGSTHTFTYNLQTQSADYLHKLACNFPEYRMTLNLYQIIGKCFIGKVNRNKGYLNLVVVKSITEEEMAKQLKSMEEQDEEFVCCDEDGNYYPSVDYDDSEDEDDSDEYEEVYEEDEGDDYEE